MKKPELKNGESPFKNLPPKVYAYLKAQLPDAMSFTPDDLGHDATEEIVIDYFKENYGLPLRPYADRDPRARIVRHAAQAKKGKAKLRADALQEGRDALDEAASALHQTPIDLDAAHVRQYWATQNGGCEDLVLVTHLAAAGLRLRALFEGPPGIGKSRATVEALDALALPDACHVKVVAGHVTPLAGYQLLHDYRDPGNLLVFDEAFVVTHSPDLQAILKDALFLGEVAWTSTKDLPNNLPSQFRYQGNVLLNANAFGNGADAAALRDRLFCLKLVLTRRQVLAKMASHPDRQAHLDAAIRRRIIGLRSGRHHWPVLTEADVAYVTHVLEHLTRDWPAFAPLSFRHLQKGLLLMQGMKGLLGWTPETRAWYEALLDHSLDAASPATFLLRALAAAGGSLKMTELRDLAMQHYGIAKTTAYDRITALKDAGLIDDDGHRVAILTTPPPQSLNSGVVL